MFGDIAQTLAESLGISWGKQRRANRLAKVGSLPCGLRVVYGDEPGLSPDWRNGVARLRPGLLMFTPNSKGSECAIVLSAVDEHHTRQPTSKEIWRSVNPDSTIIGVSTLTARLEWAFAKRQLDWVLSEVEPRP